MKIVLDCRSVYPGMGGIGRSTAALARHLPAHLPHDELVLLTGARTFEEPLASGENVSQHQVDAAMIDPTFEQVRLPDVLEDLSADVYHGTCFSVPIVRGRVARVATVHDVVFKRHPELVERRLREYLDRWTHVSVELADVVVTVSEFSRKELRALYGCPPWKIEVVPNAADERFAAITRREPRGERFVLCVGTIEPKKNVLALMDAFDRLLELDPELPHQLVFAGGAGGAPFDVEAALACFPRSRSRMHVLGHVSDEALLQLYASADLFCYLSAYEGFGLPPLEAMTAGLPCVVADRGAIPEVVRDAAALVDPDRRDDVAEAMRLLLNDDRRADALVRRGRSRAKQYSWARAARQLAAAYRTAHRRRLAEDAPEPDQDGAPPQLRVMRREDA